MVDELNDPLQHTLEGLLSTYDFDNLLVQKRFRIVNKIEGNTQVRWMFAIKESACEGLYGADDTQPHGSHTPELFRAFVGEDGEQRFTNFVSNCFPLMKEPWRELLQKQEFAFPNSTRYLPAMLEMLHAALHAELEQLGIDHSRENANRLLGLRLALGTPLIPGASPVTGMPGVLVQWLAAGIDLSVILYAFGPRSGRQSLMNVPEPLIPLQDAKDAAGIPLRRLRALYPELEQESTRWF